MNRRAILLLVLVAFFSIILQTVILPFYIVPAFKPDLLLIVVVYLALRNSFSTGASSAWLLGLLKDVYSGLYFGLNAFSFLIVFLVIKNVADRLYAESSFLFVVTVSVATVASVAINFLLLITFSQTSSNLLYSMAYDLIPNVLVNSFVASLAVFLPSFSRNQEVA